MLGINITLQNFVQIGHGVSFLCMHDFAHQIVYWPLLVFFSGSSNCPQLRCPQRFWCKIHQKTRHSVRMCVLGVMKPNTNLTFRHSFFPKKMPFIFKNTGECNCLRTEGSDMTRLNSTRQYTAWSVWNVSRFEIGNKMALSIHHTATEKMWWWGTKTKQWWSGLPPEV